MKQIAVLTSLLLSSCFYLGRDQIEEIVAKPSSQWSSRECLTILMSGVGNNLARLKAQANTNIEIFATPYCPVMIEAINRTAQQRNHWTEEDFRTSTEILTRDALGALIDLGQDSSTSEKGGRGAGTVQLDSLMFLVSLSNIGGATQFPDISSLEQHILLVNEKNLYIKPLWVWGKRRNILTSIGETILVMFQLRSGSYHFLGGAKRFSLVVTGFQGMKSDDLKLDFPVSLLEYKIKR